ncbi:4'-phosphopantetheinyl transferase superfamily protein [Arthrobacter crusticola]|uniref:4'-phosphopantetheinyl transferase superfamily protein n=1 Tax=Arthrobacter crusticola TaxID=2547960 RepID=A0A4R5U033_9MICC|nr:4'-phosphopantetheinyl transferase superfamily protein [Arthrobacter crusticola]TDK26876.1 4'-phosphopantetheinyl transferase superfamily protein [Arthrobacter crusticola]
MDNAAGAVFDGVFLTARRLSEVDPALAVLLDDAELRRAAAFRAPAPRQRFLAGRILLRQHASRLAQVPPERLRADYRCSACSLADGVHGQPRYTLPASASAPALRMSLSRSGDWCLTAGSADMRLSGLGVDIEAGPLPAPDGFEEVALAPGERRLLRRMTGAQRTTATTRIWVRKEAVLKALGIGMDLDPSLVDASASVPLVPGGDWRNGQWHTRDITPGAVGLPREFTAALAVFRGSQLST